MPKNQRITSILICCLIQLFLCRNIDSERITSSSLIAYHGHGRRSITHDPRYLGFSFDTEPENTFVNPDGYAIFHCKYHFGIGRLAGTDFESRIEWRKDGTSIDHIRSVGRITILTNGSLLIENANPSDEGIYQCAVYVTFLGSLLSTPNVFLSRRVTLSSPVLDRFEYQPINQKVFANQNAAFRCLLNSKPNATIEWYKDNHRLKDEDGFVILPLSQTLEIYNVSRKHVGSYKCIARNSGKSRASQIATLDLDESTNDVDTISVLLEPRSQVHKASDSLILECLVNGVPTPKVQWLHNSLPISESNKIHLVGSANTSLLIRNAHISDAGTYTCMAENKEDHINSSAIVSIRTLPTIITSPKDVVTQETLDIEFECVAEGFPKPRITWYKNGEVIIPSEYFVIASNKLKIFGLVKDDQGIYQCFADNDMGSVQVSAQLIVDAAASHLALTAGSSVENRTPLQPLGLQATEITSRSISLRWDPNPGSADIKLFHIFYREEESTRERLVNSTTTESIITSLLPNTEYIIRVSGENQAGLGKSSEAVNIKTKYEATVPGKVRNFRAEVLGSETIQVDWDSPSTEAGSEAFRYRLFYRKSNSLEDEHETQVLMVKTSYTLHSMDQYTKYRIRVEAEGANGVGPSSDIIEVQTFSDVPSGAPQNIRLETPTSNVIRLSWDRPPPEECNGVITGYKIRYKTKRKGSKGNVIVVENNVGTYTIENVEQGSHYTVRIAAMTQNGTGVFSDWLGINTPIAEREETQIAGAPAELRVRAGHDFIHVFWLPPRDESIMIRGYLIGWGVNIPDVEKATVNANVRQYTIKGLKPSREYVISLRAFNNIGNGFPIYETVKTSAYGYGPVHHNTDKSVSEDNDDVSHFQNSRRTYASPPVGVTADPVSSSAIRVSWTDPNDNFNQYYTIRYTSSSDNNGQLRFINTSETEQVIDGLRPNTQYEFAVKLIESYQWSMSAVNKTFPAPPSSAPRDLSIFASHNDPNTVTLSWQPPKYANGEIEEYIVLYSDRLDLPDREWVMDNARGDRLSMVVKNLLPGATYYFKIQARNMKGYGPLSSVATYVSEFSGLRISSDQGGINFVGNPPHENTDTFYVQMGQLLTTNFIYVLIGIVSVVLLFLIVVLTIVCVQRKSPSNSLANSKKRQQGYVEGRKFSSSTLNRNNVSQPDLWIQQNGARFALLNGGQEMPVDFMETPQNIAHDLKRFAVGAQLSTESPPRYQIMQDNIMSSSQISYYSDNFPYGCSPMDRRRQHRKSLPTCISSSALFSSMPQSAVFPKGVQHHCDDAVHYTAKPFARRCSIETDNYVKKNQSMDTKSTQKINMDPMVLKNSKVKSVNFSPQVSFSGENNLFNQSQDDDRISSSENGTLLRSYHQSSTSLEIARQKTPQILYTGVNRQPIAKVDFISSEHGSYCGSTTALQIGNTPPPVLNCSNDTNDGPYQTVRGLNPLKSFTQMGGQAPPVANGMNGAACFPGNSHADQRKTAHVVRPVVFASPNMRENCKPSGNAILGQKPTQLPIGRATAQPRVNVSDDRYSPYSSTVRVMQDGHPSNDDYNQKRDECDETKPLKSVPSTEDINVHEIDHMIDTLQQLQQEFTEG